MCKELKHYLLTVINKSENYLDVLTKELKKHDNAELTRMKWEAEELEEELLEVKEFLLVGIPE